MATSLQKLYDPIEIASFRGSVSNSDVSVAVDIVAVHGLNGDQIQSWVHPETNSIWLKQIGANISIARVLSYGYNSNSADFFGRGCVRSIQEEAQKLVLELQVDRKINECSRKPIIFICHGFGGVIVKQALLFSSSQIRTTRRHLFDIFVSTFAILFFGTPHLDTDRDLWMHTGAFPEPYTDFTSSPITPPTPTFLENFQNFMTDSECLKVISQQFFEFSRQFHIFCFWEEKKTLIDSHFRYVVSPASANPSMYSRISYSIPDDHEHMVKFRLQGLAYQIEIESALKKFALIAPQDINARFTLIDGLQDQSILQKIGFEIESNKIFELKDKYSDKSLNKYFHPPQEVTSVFIGRQNIVQCMAESFFPEDNSVLLKSVHKYKRFVIHGMGGTGKTQLCCRFTEDYQQNYWAIFTIQAFDKDQIKSSFAKLGKLGGLKATYDSGKYWLSQIDKPFLIIIDNADDQSLDLTDLFPLNPNAHVLITTRNPDFRQYATVGHIELKGLAEDEAVQLLLIVADIKRPWNDEIHRNAREIVKALGYLALAVIQAGKCIFRRICDLSGYLKMHKTARQRYQHRFTHQADSIEGDEIIESVYSTFDLSLSYLYKHESLTNRDAIELLKIMAFFHPEYIRKDIFTRAICNVKKLYQETSFLSRIFKRIIYPPPILPQFLRTDSNTTRPERASRALAQLRSSSLINYDNQSDSFSLHPLIHAWAKDSLSPIEKKVWAQVALSTLTTAVQLPPDDMAEEHTQFHREILPHFKHCLMEASPSLPPFTGTWGKIELAIPKIAQPTRFLILSKQILEIAKIGYVFIECGEFSAGANHLVMVKETLAKILGYNDDTTMLSMLGLAGAYWGLGRLEEAIALQKQVVEIRSKLKKYGPHHEDTLSVKSQLGHSYWLNGQYKEAKEVLEEVTTLMRDSLGSSHPLTLIAMDNLGVTLSSWQRYEDSYDLLVEVLNTRIDSLGETHKDTLSTKQNLAMVLLDLDRHHESLDLIEFVHQTRQKQLGKEHPWTLWALCCLSKVHCKMGDLTTAQKYLEKGIPAAERSLGKEHPGVLMGQGELSRVYARQGKLKEAEELSVNTLAMIEKYRGKHHPDYIYGNFKLAQLYQLQKEPRKSIEKCNIALQLSTSRLGKSHPLVLKIELLKNRLKSSTT